MKKCCKNTDILKPGFIEHAMQEALHEKWKRNDVLKYFKGYAPNTPKPILKDILASDRQYTTGLIETAAEAIRYEIQNRCLSVEPIQYSERYDPASEKTREIGKECVKQLILDEIAREGLAELWKRKLGYHQYASIKGKGQLSGKETIEYWMRKKPAKTRYAWKGDARHCYQSVDTRRLKRMLIHDVKNPTLLYLVFFLLDTYKQGLNIGSGLSQFLCNYYLARAYHYVLSLHKVRKHRDGTVETRKLAYFAIFYMDDIQIFGSREADVKMAARSLIKFLAKEYAITIKPNQVLFRVDYKIKTDEKYKTYREKDKATRRGSPVDMMGFKIYRDHTEMRRKIFIKGRHAFAKAWGYMCKGLPVSLKIAQSCISRYGWFKNTDSIYVRRKYNMAQIFRICRKVVSSESKIHRTAASCLLAAG